MTRETKIGLLVGLAFIIVIGVLLSDHLTSANNPKMSNQMAGIGGDAYTSLVTPGGANANKNVKITPPVDVLPREQVPTPTEMIVRAPEVVIPQIDITAPPAAKRDPIEIVDMGPSPSVNALPGVRIADGSSADPVVAPPVVAVAPIRSLPTVEIPAASRTEKRTHKAQAGDTVSKLAYKYYGKNTRSLRDLIVKVNPALQRSPDKIVVGQLYVIPPAPSAAPQDTVAASTVSRTMMASATTQPTPRTRAAAVSLKTYTVKANDSIWRIATEQCHDINSAKQILALNKDVLKGSNKLQIGMKLKLPEKKVS